MRADIPATINLLERAVRLLPEDDPEAVALYPELGAAMVDGGDLHGSESLYRTAEDLGDERTVLRARLGRIWLGGSEPLTRMPSALRKLRCITPGASRC